MDNAQFIDQTEVLFTSEPESEEIRLRRLREAATPIVSRLAKLTGDAVSKREEIEKRWLEDMCQFEGVRSVSDIKGKSQRASSTTSVGTATGSQVFVNITRPKTNRTEGRICDILFPADDKNWGIQPTPVPDLSVIAKRGMEEAERAKDEANRLEEAGDPMATTPEGMAAPELLQKAEDLGTQAVEAQAKIDQADRRAELMEAQIDDQLTECQYAQKARDAIGWACKIGLGVLKGPVISESGRGTWQQSEAGYALGPNESAKSQPSVECVSPWSFFPDPSATCMKDAEFVLERHLPSKRELRNMARKMGFDQEAVRELLEEGPEKGSADDLQFLSDIRLLTGETTPIEGRYVLWEYHGQLEVQEVAALIRAEGTDEADARAAEFEENADPLDDRMVIVWFCNGKLLKLTEYYPMDSGELLYSVFSFEKGNASILGAIGVPRMMRDSQEALNAAWRMMMDNAALSTGPQVLIDKTALKPADGDWTMRPRKVWLWDTTNGAGQPFQTFNIQMNQEQLAGIIALAQAFIDEETSMPRITEGGGSMEQSAGVAQTVGGLAMLMNSAGVNIRRVVKNWDDDVTAPIIRRIYDWNMQYSTRDEIKGDMKINARGTAVLLVREQQAQILMPLAQNWTVHPVLGAMLKQKGYGAARMALQTLGIDPADVLLTPEEFVKEMEAAAAMAGEAQPEDPQWQIRLQIAEMDQQTRIQVAQLQHESDMMRLAEGTRTTLEKIAADLQKVRDRNEVELQKEQIKSQSGERKLAVEVAVEAKNKSEAEAKGMQPTGSGGAISMGAEPL